MNRNSLILRLTYSFIIAGLYDFIIIPLIQAVIYYYFNNIFEKSLGYYLLIYYSPVIVAGVYIGIQNTPLASKNYAFIMGCIYIMARSLFLRGSSLPNLNFFSGYFLVSILSAGAICLLSTTVAHYVKVSWGKNTM